VDRLAPGSSFRGPAVGVNLVATYGSAGMAAGSPAAHRHRSGGPSRRDAVVVAAAFDRSLTHGGRAERSQRRCAESELIWPLRLADEVPATLRQLLVNSAARVPGAGRVAGAAPVRDSFDRSAIRREALGCKGYRDAGNSVSTLGQLSDATFWVVNRGDAGTTGCRVSPRRGCPSDGW
jgi:hypothetical protein